MNENERLLKMEHDAWLAQAQAAKNEAVLEYIAMMTDVEIPTEEETDNEREI